MQEGLGEPHSTPAIVSRAALPLQSLFLGCKDPPEPKFVAEISGVL